MSKKTFETLDDFIIYMYEVEHIFPTPDQLNYKINIFSEYHEAMSFLSLPKEMINKRRIIDFYIRLLLKQFNLLNNENNNKCDYDTIFAKVNELNNMINNLKENQSVSASNLENVTHKYEELLIEAEKIEKQFKEKIESLKKKVEENNIQS
jgi:hypothetical protein